MRFDGLLSYSAILLEIFKNNSQEVKYIHFPRKCLGDYPAISQNRGELHLLTKWPRYTLSGIGTPVYRMKDF